MAKDSGYIKGAYGDYDTGDYKGGPGKYDGANDQGLPTRTPSPNAVPEKLYDESVPLPKGQD